jgi:2-oxo-hept-3-ene-1,7-dioate hydratase
MSVGKDEIRVIAQDIQQAYVSRKMIRPLTQTRPGITLEHAYAVQQAWIDLKVEQGARVVGHKIGLTSKAMQSTSLVDEPDYGALLDDTVYQDGIEIPPGLFGAPRVEIELAFVMKGELRGPRCTIFDVLNATDYVTPAIEVLDSRIEKVDSVTGIARTIVDSICDNAGYAALITGGRPFRPTESDLRWIAGLCLRNGQIEETGVSAGVLGHPANAIAWLVNKFAAHGTSMKAGEVLLSGSFIRPVEARAGDTFCADFGPFGSVSCHFSQQDRKTRK